ncbi:uncharacterized protein SETTUDRAFT_166821 [Exserohilum turcica Et28A]|uniref:Uncharacterized protein n=1 Tax=Exserohilum turcicum (strain 28A) TaxID=671987 RepID=R0KDG1_EXST2|nr:uncharacterized protein SETTUDRAFT_166821 [Exserohilum turcica Et28A]EOA90948.1 hypothetical protein SETTUDRAFT_166821 [Exserohilum turcica Et28A]
MAAMPMPQYLTSGSQEPPYPQSLRGPYLCIPTHALASQSLAPCLRIEPPVISKGAICTEPAGTAALTQYIKTPYIS